MNDNNFAKSMGHEEQYPYYELFFWEYLFFYLRSLQNYHFQF